MSYYIIRMLLASYMLFFTGLGLIQASGWLISTIVTGVEYGSRAYSGLEFLCKGYKCVCKGYKYVSEVCKSWSWESFSFISSISALKAINKPVHECVKLQTDMNKMELSQIKLDSARQIQPFLDKIETINATLTIARNILDICSYIKNTFFYTPKVTSESKVYHTTSIFNKKNQNIKYSTKRNTSSKVLYVISKN